MIRQITSLIFILILPINAFSFSCNIGWTKLLTRSNQEADLTQFDTALKKRRFLKDLRQKANNIMAKNGSDLKPAINEEIEYELAILDTQLIRGDYSVPFRQWVSVFDSVEISMAIIQKLRKLEAFARQLPTDQILNDDDAVKILRTQGRFSKATAKEFASNFLTAESRNQFYDEIAKEVQTNLAEIGQNYQKYMMTRNHIEGLMKDPECKDKCQKNIKRILERIGVDAASENYRYPSLLTGVSKPKIEEVKRFLYSHFVADVSRLEREIAREIVRAKELKLLSGTMYSTLMVTISKSRLANKSGITGLVRDLMNRRARRLTFPKINPILKAKESLEVRFSMLAEVNTTVDGDEVLIDFSRRVDLKAKRMWNEFLEYAKNNHSDFHQRMLKAIEYGHVRGEVSYIYAKSRNLVTGAMVSAITLISLWAIWNYTGAQDWTIQKLGNIFGMDILEEILSNEKFIEILENDEKFKELVDILHNSENLSEEEAEKAQTQIYQWRDHAIQEINSDNIDNPDVKNLLHDLSEVLIQSKELVNEH